MNYKGSYDASHCGTTGSDSFDIVGNAPLELVAKIFEHLGHTSAMKYQLVSRTWKHKLSSDMAMKASLSRWTMPGDLLLSCERQDPLPSKSHIARKRVEQIQRFRLGIPNKQTCIPLGDRDSFNDIPGQWISYCKLSLCGEVVAWIASHVLPNAQSRVVAHNLRTSERFISTASPSISDMHLNSQFLVWITEDECTILNLATWNSSTIQSRRRSGQCSSLNDFSNCRLSGDRHYIAIYPSPMFLPAVDGIKSIPVQICDAAKHISWTFNINIPRACIGKEYREDDSTGEIETISDVTGLLRVDASAKTISSTKITTYLRRPLPGIPGLNVQQCQHTIWFGQYSLDGILVSSSHDPLEADTNWRKLNFGTYLETDRAGGHLFRALCKQWDTNKDDCAVAVIPHDNPSSHATRLVAKLRNVYNRGKMAYTLENVYMPWKDVEVFFYNEPSQHLVFKRSKTEIDFLPNDVDRPELSLDYFQEAMPLRSFLYPEDVNHFVPIEPILCNEWFLVALEAADDVHYGRIHVSSFDPDFEFPTPANLALWPPAGVAP